MSEFDIRRDVPVTPPRATKYPWPKMDIGDSIECGDYTHALQRNVLTSGRYWCSRYRPDCRVVTRKVEGKLIAWLVTRDEE